MKRLNCLTMYAIAAIVLFCGGFANAVELGDPNVTVTDGNVSITNTGGAFISRLDVNSPTALTGSTPIRMTVGHSGARFFMQAYGSGAAGNLQNAATLGAVASRLLIGADAGASVMFYSNGQFATGPGHLFIQGTPGATMGFVGIGNNAPTTKLDVTGEVKMTVANITGGSDLAEKFEVRTVANTKIEPGMVVCIDPDKPG
ncbi:MAG: hypothetical protein SGI88_18385, partial [Candidatus Hydrogenedentes bacterium]|nr:hypothetical protein [Candidatus Hydrogenedentota bacterium]